MADTGWLADTSHIGHLVFGFGFVAMVLVMVNSGILMYIVIERLTLNAITSEKTCS